MKYLTLLFLLLSTSFNANGGDETFPRTGVLPEIITSSDPVRIGIANMLSPCISSSDTDPTFYHLSESNHITFVFVAFGAEPCLNIPGFGLQYETQPLSPGTYTLQVYIVGGPSSIPLTINDPLGIEFGEVVEFAVQGFAATPVPTTSTFGLIFLIMLVLFITCLKSKKLKIFSILIIFSPSLMASKEYILLISKEEGAPTANQIVNQANTSPPPGAYLLDTFNEINPETVRYYLSERPFGQRLDLITQYPDWTLSTLYRYIIVTYDESIENSDLLDSFGGDQFIETASNLESFGADISSLSKSKNASNSQKGGFIGDFISDLDINLAWELSEGMGYIGIIDTGIDVDHPAFRAFSDTGDYLGGNLLDYLYQLDLASGDLNVDEQEPLDTGGVPSFEACDQEYIEDNNLAISIFVGHGTHVSGIIAAKDDSFSGICKNCGIGVMKWSKFANCLQNFDPPTLGQETDKASIGNYFEILSTTGGYGTVNWSGGFFKWNNDFTEIVTDENFCLDVDNLPFCNSLKMFRENNVMMVSSGGNHRVGINFPASEKGTVAVGGLSESGSYWNESPGPGGIFDFSDNSNCPYSDARSECGSNISHPPIDQKVDASTQSRAVRSTFYRGGRWNDFLDCTDSNDGIPDDGYGFCTGTSMSSPQVAAIMQLLRSTNPLLPNGTYDPGETLGLINVLNATSGRSFNNQAVNNYVGYGIPSASLALVKILGYSNGQLMKTRLTPMFEIVSVDEDNDAINNVYSPFPQLAFAFLAANGSDYESNISAPLVQEFSQYWHGPNVVLSAPRASFYVFTTNNNPFVDLKNMVPLRRMEKTISGNNRNDTYAVSPTEIEDFHDEGYNYAGIEGYIFPTCPLEPGCIPANAQKLYRVVDDVNFNHTLVNLPVNDPAPANSTKLGYVFPNIDTDGDGLIDGQERILGTLINVQDTDGDGTIDGVEYPPAGVPVSDPRISDIIFENGFE